MSECIDLHDAELVIRRMTNLDIGSRCIPVTTRPPQHQNSLRSSCIPCKKLLGLFCCWGGRARSLLGWRLQPP